MEDISNKIILAFKEYNNEDNHRSMYDILKQYFKRIKMLASGTSGRDAIVKINGLEYYYYISEYEYIDGTLKKLDTPKIELERRMY